MCCMSPFECQMTGQQFQDGIWEALSGKFQKATAIALEKRGHTGQQNRNGDKRHKDTLKLHSDREKHKEKSKIPTVTWLFPQYIKQ